MNWIILEPGEIDSNGVAVLGGRRAEHVREVLDAAPGDELRIGIVDGPTGKGTVRSSTRQEAVLEVAFDDEVPPPPPPWIDLVLAMPRPRVMRRLLRQLTTLGVRNIELIGAERVEKCYFAAHWLKDGTVRELLLEGLEQAGSTAIPNVRLRPSFKRFMLHDLPAEYPYSRRFIAHPGPVTPELPRAETGCFPLLAVGPEGGWIPSELEMLANAGFEPISLGPRILRSDTASIALLSILSRTLDPACAH